MNNHGFTLLKEASLSEVGGTAKLYRHDQTGAELLSILNNDENKCFGVSFRTPPKDSTGVAHILEHSVLCGSKKYPVKEPFVELLKSSLQTFLNAMTFPDKTCYPVASTNLQDFYNLIDVYLDAVFYPRIDEDVLRQEGWHIDVTPDGKWQYKGVVFNEMKGVYSSPDSVLMEQSQQAVFPDNLYSLDSGGNPPEILNLTYHSFKSFHTDYYHPSNSLFFFWGDDPEEQRLSLLADLLADFEPATPAPVVALQKRLPMPRKIERYFAAGQTEDGAEDGAEAEGRGHVTVNWLLCESGDVEQMLLLQMLEHILAGLPGSPLRRALLESGLGEDLAGAGLETDLRQSFFSIGLRSILPETADEVEKLILDTLHNLAEQGLPTKAVEAALNSAEFELRENNTGRFPRGLAAMFRALSTWLYNGDPFAPMAWEAPLASVKERLAKGEPLFEQAIKTWLLDNPHRASVVLIPDSDLAARMQAEEDARLQAAKAAMSPAEQAETAAIALRLEQAQTKPDLPEDLAKIPVLGLADLPRENKILPQTILPEQDPQVILHDIDTTGIVYAKILLSLAQLPEQYFPLLPLYARALTEMGTKARDYVDLGLEVAAKTGNLGAFLSIHTHLQDAAPLTYLEISGKATADKANDLSALMAEIMTQPDFSNAERFGQMVREEKARLEQSIVPAGHGLVSLRLAGQLSLTGHLAEITSGVDYINYIRSLAQKLDSDPKYGLDDLRQLHQLIMRKPGSKVSLTAEQSVLDQVKPLFADLAAGLPGQTLPGLDRSVPARSGNQALLVPAQVNYVGLGANLKATGYQYSGSLNVILRHLRMGYLWDKVRVQGGAYGIFANYSRGSGAFSFLSYRDPNVLRTLEVYQQAPTYLKNLDLSRSEVEKAILGAIGDLDTYLLPGAKGNTALWRYLTGEDNKQRQQIREQILATSLDDFHAFAPYLEQALADPLLCVLGGADAQAAAAANNWRELRLL